MARRTISSIESILKNAIAERDLLQSLLTAIRNNEMSLVQWRSDGQHEITLFDKNARTVHVVAAVELRRQLRESVEILDYHHIDHKIVVPRVADIHAAAEEAK